VATRVAAIAPPVLQHASRQAPPCAMVVFGASGDLTHRKLVPALYRVMETGSLTDRFAAVGVARRPYTNQAFSDEMRESVRSTSDSRPFDPDTWERFAAGLYYVPGEFHDAATYERLKAQLEKLDREHGLEGNRLYYLATPSSEFATILERLKAAGMISTPGGSEFLLNPRRSSALGAPPSIIQATTLPSGPLTSM